MSTLADALQEYLALRRALGTKLKSNEYPLRRFVEFAEREGADVVTTDLVLRWTGSQSRASLATRGARFGDVRRFAAWLSATDPRTQVPPRDLLPSRFPRTPPYIYTDAEVASLIETAARLRSRKGLRGLTYAALFGTLAATGLRISEAVALDRDDVDLADGVLAVRHAKLGKARFVPLHESARAALSTYARHRDRVLRHAGTPAFFVAESGRRVKAFSAQDNFAVVSRVVGLRTPAGRARRGHGPRLHDLRHRLAVRTLVRWYREGRDVEREIPRLSTYLGHAHLTDTYWYLEAVPELLELATERVSRPPEAAR